MAARGQARATARRRATGGQHADAPAATAAAGERPHGARKRSRTRSAPPKATPPAATPPVAAPPPWPRRKETAPPKDPGRAEAARSGGGAGGSSGASRSAAGWLTPSDDVTDGALAAPARAITGTWADPSPGCAVR